MKNKKKLFGKTMGLIAALVLCFGMTVLAAPSVTGDTELTVQKDKIVSASYKITNDDSIESVKLTLSYDKSDLTYMSGSGGDNFSGSGGNGLVELSSNPGSKAATFGVKFKGLTDGTSEVTVSSCTITVNGKEIDALSGVSLEEEEEENAENTQKEKTVDDLRRVQIQNANGGLHNLQDLASINYGRGRSRIMRVNQDKQIEVFYNFSKDVESSKDLLEGYRSDIDQLVANYNLPAGVAVEVFHEEDEFADFKFLILAAFILIFMILASVFESLVTPFVLLFSIPLAAIGSLLALLLTNNSLLNANTLTGFLILLGVVVNNGIILIDYSNILRKQGYRRNRALMTAGLSRIRPILITSITTIVAMFPLAMGDSEYAGAIGAPFAITVIGGLTFSALLTLILIPTVCMGLENTLEWYRSLSRKVWVLHLVLFVLGVTCIWLYGNGMLWQSIYLVILIFGIPGVTYFAQTSLRRAKSKVIDPGEEIHISVRNLVKIYDWPGRISRQWNSGLLIRRHLGLSNEYRSLKDFVNVIWQFGLLLFGIYFTWFFIHSKLWIFLLSFAIYATLLYLWRKVRQYLFFRFGDNKWVKYINRAIFWSIPPVILFILFRKMDNTGLISVVGLLWAFCIAVYISSQYLYEREINIERIKGRLAGLRRSWFRMVKSIPLIGKQRKPFKRYRQWLYGSCRGGYVYACQRYGLQSAGWYLRWNNDRRPGLHRQIWLQLRGYPRRRCQSGSLAGSGKPL